MAQMTGTNILAFARVFAQDTSALAPAVDNPTSLMLLNDVLVRWTGDVKAKTALVPASESGLAFAANAAVGTATLPVGDDAYDTILAAYPSDSNTLSGMLSPQLTMWTVEQMLVAHNNDGSGTVAGGGTREWQAFAWERMSTTAQNTGVSTIRVYVYPALGATRYLTIRVPKQVILNVLADTPDITRREALIVARLLAWEMARLHQRDEAFLQQILSPIPTGVLDKYFESAKTHGWMQAAIRETGALDG